jgi:hypothetical protein
LKQIEPKKNNSNEAKKRKKKETKFLKMATEED